MRRILIIFIKILFILYVYCLNLFENFDWSVNFFICIIINYSVLYYVMLFLIFKNIYICMCINRIVSFWINVNFVYFVL